MKKLATCLTVLCVLAGLRANAQCIQNDFGTDSLAMIYWIEGALSPTGGMVGAMQSDVTQDVIALRMNSDGSLAWKQRVRPTNPSVTFWAREVAATPDGGVAVFGYRFDIGYSNMFIIKFDMNGNREWGRIYMMSSETSYDWTTSTDIAALSDGSLLLSVARGNGMCAVKLDSQGIPQWQKRYNPSTNQVYWWTTGWEVAVNDNDEMAFVGMAQDELYVVRADANGDPLWGHRWEMTGLAESHISWCSNGDLLVCGHWNGDSSAVARIDATGNMLWLHEYLGVSGSGSISQTRELSNGNLALMRNYAIEGNLLVADANGTLLQEWNASLTRNVFDLAGVKNDSLYFVTTEFYDTQNQYPIVWIAPTSGDIGCGLTPGTLDPNSAFSAGIMTDTLNVEPDSIKTWTLSMQDASLEQMDLELYLGSTNFRPGFLGHYYGTVYSYGGGDSGPVTATLTYDPILSFDSSDPAPTSVVGNVVTWSALPAIPSLGGAFFDIRFTVPPDVGLIGTTIAATFDLSQDSTEYTLANNTFSVSRTITGSFDPNEKTVVPEGFYNLDTDTVLDYTIQFQNTGTDTAFTVVVRDTLPLDLDATTLRMGAASHPYTYSLTGSGLLTVTFNNILLVDSNTNEPASHGLVNFQIKPNQPLALGTVISNTADIYFDFNPPVITDPAVVVVTDATGVVAQTPPARLSVFPIPANDRLQAILPAGFKPQFGYIVGADGRRQPARITGGKDDRLDLSIQQLRPGLYVLTLFGTNGQRLSARFTKE